jgi:hypothetical protein
MSNTRLNMKIITSHECQQKEKVTLTYKIIRPLYHDNTLNVGSGFDSLIRSYVCVYPTKFWVVTKNRNKYDNQCQKHQARGELVL